MEISSRSHGNTPFSSADPYLRWHTATKFSYLPDDRSKLPITFKLTDKESKQSIADLLAISSDRRTFEVPSNQRNGEYLTLVFAINQLRHLLRGPRWKKLFVRYIAGQFLHQDLATADLNNWPAPKPLPEMESEAGPSSISSVDAESPKVILAVIDDGIAFAHQRFSDENGLTRIHAFWDQDSPHWLTRSYIEYTKSTHRFGSDVDEDALYSSEGLNDFATDEHKRVARRFAHGTHVLDLAASLPRGSKSSDKPIIAVQLPRQVTSDPSGIGLAPQIDLALKFINARMSDFEDANGEQPALVVNLSYGMTGGPQDGSHFVEELIDDFVSLREGAGHRTEFVIAAGNVRLERGHAEVVAGLSPTPIYWRLQPDDRTPSALEIWVPPNERVEVRVKGPTDQTFGAWVKEDGEYPSPYATAPCMIDYRTIPTASGRRLVLIRTLPTASPEPLVGTSVAPSGIWTIEVMSGSTSTVPVNIYVQRDDTPLGYKRLGRQSYLEDVSYTMYKEVSGAPVDWDHEQKSASPVIRLGTLNAIATGPCPFVVAGFRGRDETSSRYSSLGANHAARCPSVAVTSDDSPAMHGVLAAGTHCGSTFAMNGTSVAAPQLSRWISEVFAANPKISAQQLRGLLKASVKTASKVPSIARTQAVGDGLLAIPQVTELRTGGFVKR